MRGLSNELLIHDPHIDQELILENERASFEQIINCDIISIHVHLAPDTQNLIDESFLSRCKPDMLMVNTSRGGVVNEEAMADFLHKNNEAVYATDVLADELSSMSKNVLLSFPNKSQIIITPHIGGMTKESRALAYGRAAQLLKSAVQNSE
jgi:phosphoglycerate dehydrogenase-like enzyme